MAYCFTIKMGRQIIQAQNSVNEIIELVWLKMMSKYIFRFCYIAVNFLEMNRLEIYYIILLPDKCLKYKIICDYIFL